MALELRQQLKLTQKLVMTQQLRQAIQLLQLNRLELTAALQAEMEVNPMLEEVVETAAVSGSSEALDAPEVSTPVEPPQMVQVRGDDPRGLAEVNWDDYANSFESEVAYARETPQEEAPSPFDFISKKPGIDSHLRWQVVYLQLSPADEEVAETIIGNIDDHGFLQASIEEISAATGAGQDAVAEVLRKMQAFDPPGIAARSVQESLLLQLERRGLGGSLAATIVRDQLPLLETRNYTALARSTGASPAQVTEAMNVITSLTPYPGNEYSGEDTSYIIPDVFVFKVEDRFVIRLNDDGLPQLRLSAEYQSLLGDPSRVNGEGRSYLRDKLRNAEWFIKSVEQRQRTIYKVMESLLKFQYEFFEHGPSRLKPLILRDVADDIGMHESTISRVTSHKYAHTPQGIFELKFFFSTGLSGDDGEMVAAASIRNRIQQIVKAEAVDKPLSDSHIAEMLAGEGIRIARRTIAKYREQLGILPVNLRRRP
ncbi:MAG: RNA polymerase sigma-54 factor [Desulfobulbaceae bacterium A2]|nr:MAG: RNA polymerase sigma-54 factor [Desulfobulbaceae bacterium A2]